jgi:tripartite-type tricarboxylate transporter receptor subunit TctC
MKLRLKVAALLWMLALGAGHACAQGYPNKPIQWLIPFPAGGPTDVLGRAIAPKLSEALGVPVIIVNKSGAGGTLAMDLVAKGAPDGYTIGMGHTGTQSISPHLYAKLPYDSLKDYAPITPVVSYVNVLVMNPNLPATTVAELVAYAKANPQKVSFGSGGIGTTQHVSGELLKSVTGAPMLHVPYKGTAPALVDVMAGNASFTFVSPVAALPHMRTGKLRALAVTSAKRSQYVPDIPTMRESGVEGYEEAGSELWFGVFAPAGTPKPIVDRLNAELVKAMESAEVAEHMRVQSFDRWTLTPEEFTAFLRVDYVKWGKVVKFSGAKAD